MNHQFSSYFLNILYLNEPDACAQISGAPDYPDLYGSVLFYSALNGCLILTQLIGLPHSKELCSPRFLGFHIHEGAACSGNETDAFADAGTHFNPYDCPHPKHVGDLPPLLVNDGIAWSLLYSSHFTVPEIMGRTVIVHSNADNFLSQPSGNSGKKIGCGVIQPIGSPITDLT